MWRCWVCRTCKVVSYHPLTYCPRCPNKLERVDAPSAELEKMFPEKKYYDKARPTGDWTPYEYDPQYTLDEQPWRARNWKIPSELQVDLQAASEMVAWDLQRHLHAEGWEDVIAFAAAGLIIVGTKNGTLAIWERAAGKVWSTYKPGEFMIAREDKALTIQAFIDLNRQSWRRLNVNYIKEVERQQELDEQNKQILETQQARAAKGECGVCGAPGTHRRDPDLHSACQFYGCLNYSCDEHACSHCDEITPGE